jgi:argininosuccinate synthase
MEKVILAFSGGLDTTVCVKLLEEEYNLEVITACVDVGQGQEELETAEKVAKELGVKKHYTIDSKDEFANEYIARGIKANALYEGYPLSTALARPLIAMKIIEIAEKENAKAIAHGCTGKGNDQFRFEAVIRSMSDFDIVAPIRDLNLTRTEEQDYAKKCGIAISSDKIYSIDENIWGRSIEGDILENPENEPPEDIYAWTASAEDAKDSPTKVAVEFNEGVPVAINGKMMPMIELIGEANKIAGENGIGRIDTIENRMIGLKSREIYEVPGALLLIQAHQALEELVLTKDEILFAQYMSTKYADLIYCALWQEPLREDMDQAIDNMQSRVTGKVVMKLFKGSILPLSRESDYSLHDIELISFEDKENDQKEVEGMIKYHGLQASIYQKLNR